MHYNGHMEDFVLITGLSGAGKSQAMATFEDAGYFCVDNLPPEMIGTLAELFGHEGSKVERAAVASDVRGGVVLRRARAVLDDLEHGGVPVPPALPGGRRAGPAQPLQGDPPPPPAGRRRLGGGGHRARGGAAGAAARTGRRLASTPAISRVARLRKVVADKMLPHGKVGEAGGDLHDLRLQARLARGTPT